MLTRLLRLPGARGAASRNPFALSRALSTPATSLPCVSYPTAPQTLHISEVSPESLYMLSKVEGAAQVHASRERMRREIMRVDGVDYAGATPKLLTLNKANSDGLFWNKLPYRVLYFTSVGSGVLSIPLVFSVSLARPFNDMCVTTEVPSNSELDTLLEVGAWTWNWMEPPLGTISFFLLCMQFGREASNNMGSVTPAMRHKRSCAEKLVAAYPQYHKDIVADYAFATAFDDDADDIAEDLEMYKSAIAARASLS